ncbi:hypothetical protein RYX36_026210 [Vicia faba]
MRMEYWKRSGQIPTFGNWDIANKLPITQYFENTRQAGLIHYSSSSGETDLYEVDHKKPVRKAKRIRDRRYTKCKYCKISCLDEIKGL